MVKKYIYNFISDTNKNPLFFAGIYSGFFIPDTDLLIQSILHHRSILTHSILIVLISNRYFNKSFVQGLSIGIGCHLLSDSTSPMTGFALIYIPVVKSSIGAILSWIWIFGNSILCFVYGYKIKPPEKKINYIILLIILYFISVITYGTASYALAVFGFIVFFQLIFSTIKKKEIRRLISDLVSKNERNKMTKHN